MNYFSIKNWEIHQHYKDRNPPWIKLHTALLHDYEFTCLQDASKLHLMLIWLLASQMNNKIPADPKWLKNALHIETEVDLKALSDGGFIKIDSTVLAGCTQDARPEERRGEAEEKCPSGSSEPDSFDIFWETYPRKEDKKKARRAFNRLKKSDQESATKDSSTRFNETQKQFIPLPASYINGERWNDNPLAPENDFMAGSI